MLTEEEYQASLVAALLDIERYVGNAGWDQPARLFALVRTDEFIAAQPQLAAELGLRGSVEGAPPGSLTSIEQDDFVVGDDLGETLAQMAWPTSVAGCALVLERSFLPDEAQADVPDDARAAARFVASHPDHDELRVVSGALRTDAQEPLIQGVARLRRADQLVSAPDLVPDLGTALAHTLTNDPEGM